MFADVPGGFLLLQLLFWLVPLLLGGSAIYLGVRFVRAFERRGTAQGEVQALRDRVAALEEELTRTGEEMERLAEAQRFTQRLLADRTGGGPPPA
ncbi:hypothetical protein [Roseisolibacter sp. H3M3-2]|uniref:hypothetical protein n=1 Tax=Roseisolibacter sp. H3M3-2 TaxID=3031323 RepID=UPI0023D9D746|nr:hypothetical protein [Roseisolibacter sp. H3M3-2]MDF1503633.1 hypothetical protein [Roseisolibacter sp. H3M3-2]